MANKSRYQLESVGTRVDPVYVVVDHGPYAHMEPSKFPTGDEAYRQPRQDVVYRHNIRSYAERRLAALRSDERAARAQH